MSATTSFFAVVLMLLGRLLLVLAVVMVGVALMYAVGTTWALGRRAWHRLAGSGPPGRFS
jgi:hypothetical protein